MTVTASTANNDCFGNMFVGDKLDVHSESYISFNTQTLQEANSLMSYLKCKLPNLLLKLRKITHNISATTCSWIPLPPLDRDWTDAKIYKYYKLTTQEIELVKNAVIVGYKNLDDILIKKTPDIINKVVDDDDIIIIKPKNQRKKAVVKYI